MADVFVKNSKLPAVLRRLGLCLLVLAVLVTFGACVKNGANEQTPNVQTEVREGEAEQSLRAQLANETVKEITIQGTLYFSAPIEVTSDKTIKGDGKLKAIGNWVSEVSCILVVKSGVELTLAESLTIDADGRSSGVYVSDGGELRLAGDAMICNAVKNGANVINAGTFQMDGGVISGGYDNVRVADKASFVWNAGQIKDSVHDGIHVAKGGELHITSADAKMSGAGDQGIFLEGSAVIDNVLIQSSKRNHIKIGEDAKLVMNEGTLSASKGHGITNRGTMVMNGGYITGSASCGIVNSGDLDVKGGAINSNTKKGILVRNGGKLTVNSKDVIINSNHIGIAVEENAYAEVSLAAVNANSVNNFSSFGELYLHDLVTGSSGSNCIATNYGGHVVAKNLNIVGTNGNNGIYNVNGSLVELTDVIIERTKSAAIRNLDADLIGKNVTITNCGTGISTGDYMFGKAGEVTIDNLTMTGTKNSNITTESYCGATIKLTNATLGAAGSNNVSVKGGHVILENVDIKGNNPQATTSIHGILLDEGGKITATNVSISDVKVSGLRNRGGIFVGNGISMMNIPEVGISTVLGPVNKNVGSTFITGFSTSNIGTNNIKMDGDSYVSITNADLCAVPSNNVRVSKGTLVMQNVTINGHTEKNVGNVHSIFLTGGSLEANNITVKNTETAAVRNNGGTITVNNMKVDGASRAVYVSKGTVTLNGFTTDNIETYNVYIDNADGALTIEKGTLCGIANNNNIRILSGIVTLKDTDVTGHTSEATDTVHGVLLTGGELALDNTTIHDAFSCGIRNRGGVVSGKNLTLKNIGASGISNTKEGDVLGVVNLDGLITENVGAENILGEAGTVTITNATLGICGSNSVSMKGADLVLTNSKVLGNLPSKENHHGIMVTKGAAKIENVSVENCDAAALRVIGGTVTAKELAVNGGQNFTWTSGGNVTIDGLTVEKASAENVICDGGVLTVVNASLGISNSNSVAVRGGNVVVKDSKILGTAGTGANHGIYVTGGSFTGTGLDIRNVHSALRVSNANAVAEMKDSSLKDLRDCGVNLTSGSVVLSKVSIDNPANNGIYMSGGKATAENTTINDTKYGLYVSGGEMVVNGVGVDGATYGLNASGGTVNGTKVAMDGIKSCGIQASKDAVIDVNGLRVNAPEQGSATVMASNNISLLDGKDAFTGKITVTDAALGITSSNNIAVKGGVLNLNDAQILGTTGAGSHGIYVTTGEVYSDGLEIQNVDAALRVNNVNAVLEVNNATLSELRNYGVNLSGGKVVLTDVTIDEVTAEKGYGINMSSGELTAENTNVSGAYYGLSISGGAMDAVDSSVTGATYGLNVSGGELVVNGVGVDDATYGLNASGGTVNGTKVAMDGIKSCGIQASKDAVIDVNGLRVNAPEQGSATVMASSNISLVDGEDAFTGKITVTDAVLGITSSNNVAVKGGVLNLNDAQILGTTGDGSNGIYITTGEVYSDGLDIQNVRSALRVNNAIAVAEMKNSTFKDLRDCGVNLSSGSVELSNVRIDNPANNGIYMTGGKVTAESTTITDTKYGLYISGGEMVVNGVGVDGVTYGLNAVGGTVNGTSVTIDGAKTCGINVGKSAGDITITGLSINAPDKDGKQSATATNGVLVENGYAKTIKLEGTSTQDAVIGKSSSNNIRTYSGKLILNHVDIMGTTADNAICTTATGTVEAADLEIYNVKASALRFKDSSSFAGTDVTIDTTGGTAISLHGSGTHTFNGLSVSNAGGSNIAEDENAFTGSIVISGTATNPAVLGASSSHNIRLYGGTLDLNYVDIAGTKNASMHGILTDNTVITANNVTIHDTTGSGLRNRKGSAFSGSGVTMYNIGLIGISNTSSATVNVTDLQIINADGVAKSTVGNAIENEASGGTITIAGGNIVNAGNVAVYSASTNQLTASNLEISNAGSYAIHAAGTGDIEINGLLVAGTKGENNLRTEANAGKVTLTGTATNPVVLGASPNHNIRLFGGELVMDYVDVAGTKNASMHGILSDKAVITANNVTIHDTTGSGLRNRDNAQFTGTNVSMYNIGGDGISNASGKVEITNLQIGTHTGATNGATGKGIDNSATVILHGGENAITGVGGDAVNNASGKTATIEGGSITGNVNNAGNMTLGSSVTGNVTNSGSATISGDVTGNVSNSGTELTVSGGVSGTVTNSGTMTLADGTSIGKVSNTGSLTIGKTYVSGGVYSENVIIYSGTESAHSATNPMKLTVPEANVKAGTVLVKFADNATAAALADCFAVPEDYEQKVETSVYHPGVLEVNENTLRLYKDANTYVAIVNDTYKYRTLEEAIVKAAELSNATTPATVKLMNDAELSATVKMPAESNIIITDDGTVRTIKRSASFNTSRGVMFDLFNKENAPESCKLTFSSSSNSNDNPTLILDGNNQSFYSGNCAIVVVRENDTLTVNPGVKFTNNYSTGAGAVIRVENKTGAKLIINGGVFEGNTSKGNNAGVINLQGTTLAEIRNAVFSDNEANQGGAIVVNSGAKAIIENCLFESNVASAEGGAIHILSTVKNDVVINNCTFKENSAKMGGAINLPGGCIVSVSNATFTGNTSNEQGKDIRLGNATSAIYLSGKVVAYVHNQNASTVHVEGILSEGSNVEVHWLVNDTARIPTVAVQFDSEENARKNFNYIHLSTSASLTHHLEVNGGTIVVKAGKHVARIGTTSYATLQEAVTAAAAASTADTPVTITLINDVALTKTDTTNNRAILIPAGANIIITDDGTTRTIQRANDSSWAADKRGVLFDVVSGATLTFQSTGTNDRPKLIIDGNKSNLAPTNGNWAMVNNAGTLNISAGVKFANNETTGAGSVIRLDAGSKATITGGVFDGNVAGNTSKSNSAGVINVNTTNLIQISNAVFSNNKTTNQGGAIYVNSSAKVHIENCLFESNVAGAEGGAIHILSTVKNNVVINNCTFKENNAKMGGAINLPGGCIVSVSNSTFTGNTSNEQGKDIRLGNATSTIYLSGKIVANIYNRNKSTNVINGSLSSGSDVVFDWYVNNFSATADGHTAIQFDSADALRASYDYIHLSDNLNYHLEQNENKLLLKAGK